MTASIAPFVCLLIGTSALAQPELSYLTAAPTDRYFDQDAVVELVDLIRETPPPDFRGIVVIKNDELVIEEYFHTFWRTSLHDVRSAGKSVTAMLLGIAIDRGLIKSVEDPIYNYLNVEPPTDQHAGVRIKHLLTMSSGFDADTNNPATPGQAGQWSSLDDWTPYIQRVPMRESPGETWLYTDLNTQLIGVMIENSAGMSLSTFAKKYLFDPLDIREYYWQQSRSGSTNASGNLFLTGLDFAKLGWVVLNNGKWQSQQLISKDWIREMTQPRVNLPESNPFADQYGYLWYTSSREYGGKTFTYHFASGNGGNVLIVVPSEQMVISLTSSAYGPYHGHFRSNTIFQKIMEALK